MDISKIEAYSPNTGFYNLDNKLWDHVLRRSEECFKKATEARDEIKTKEELEKYAEEKRSQFIKNMGGIPYDSSLPLNAKITGIIDEPELTIEKIIFQSRPHVYVTANLYIPKKRKDPCGAVLFQHGHSILAKGADHYQKVIRAIASAGLIVFAFDPVGQGERFSYYEPTLGVPMVEPCTSDHQYAGEQCLLAGESIARYFIADAMRAVDYMMSRPEIDSESIGATGCSGGGTATSHMMICDKRIKAAAPAAFITNRREYLFTGQPQDAEQIWINAAADGIDHHEILICFAPKPTLLLLNDSDFFCLEGSEDVYNISMRFWKMYGKSAGLRKFVDQSQHAYTVRLGEAAAGFFSEVLNGEKRSAVKSEIKAIAPETLQCTESGQVRADFPDAKFVFDENLDRIKCGKHAGIKDFLREKIDFNRKKEPLHLRTFTPFIETGMKIQPYLYFTQRQMPNYAIMFSDAFNPSGRTMLCLWDKGTNDIVSHMYYIRSLCREGWNVFVLDLTGMGKCTQHPLNSERGDMDRFGAACRLTRDLLCLGDSLCALRLFDLEYAVEMLRSHFGHDVTIHAEGTCAAYARLLSKVDENITYELENPIPDYDEIVKNRYYEDYNIAGVILPGIALYYQR